MLGSMCLPLVYGRVHIVWLVLSRGRLQDWCRKLLSQIAAEVPGAAAFQLLLSLLLTSKVATHPFAYARPRLSRTRTEIARRAMEAGAKARFGTRSVYGSRGIQG
jgi:hypothetical protein